MKILITLVLIVVSINLYIITAMFTNIIKETIKKRKSN